MSILLSFATESNVRDTTHRNHTVGEAAAFTLGAPSDRRMREKSGVCFNYGSGIVGDVSQLRRIFSDDLRNPQMNRNSRSSVLEFRVIAEETGTLGFEVCESTNRYPS